ncbi:hypothetical protein [Mycoplasmopsis synoviae]|uniref:hypothetical protein n=1 Tax=Mycoplasmopsis synoviae TaxID=2109 RepID=UPI001CE0CA9E|nr:hypothetical protein [Mycoplasmopsis synoviae]UBX97338.1 hypothetical protein K6989_03060 [Mycoplasmopsis synoviae]UBX98027.1 hypothetical protein K6987_03285 [Mycoplasmopsis synoviae]UBX98963.1 hypothetical protein K6986_01235 [Mycoplasmopsis synoviae]UBX99277.1 hypothetical protein K6988_03095 [Mycoplasmopsis synoviae]UBY00217.1 hypothetical protein K6990_01110 [Mycoplasmopsis synoviae]
MEFKQAIIDELLKSELYIYQNDSIVSEAKTIIFDFISSAKNIEIVSRKNKEKNLLISMKKEIKDYVSRKSFGEKEEKFLEKNIPNIAVRLILNYAVCVIQKLQNEKINVKFTNENKLLISRKILEKINNIAYNLEKNKYNQVTSSIIRKLKMNLYWALKVDISVLFQLLFLR